MYQISVTAFSDSLGAGRERFIYIYIKAGPALHQLNPKPAVKVPRYIN